MPFKAWSGEYSEQITIYGEDSIEIMPFLNVDSMQFCLKNLKDSVEFLSTLFVRNPEINDKLKCIASPYDKDILKYFVITAVDKAQVVSAECSVCSEMFIKSKMRQHWLSSS